jgi:hypothetical protein
MQDDNSQNNNYANPDPLQASQGGGTDDQVYNQQNYAQAVSDDHTGSGDAQTPISVPSGTPESAPIPISSEGQPENVEFGYEKLKQIENAGLEIEKIEQKETLSRNVNDESETVARAKQDIPEVIPPIPAGPKIFGYFIPPTITSNIQSIRAKKGTGDPSEAKTWIYVLLDKLLKKQTYQQQ